MNEPVNSMRCVTGISGKIGGANAAGVVQFGNTVTGTDQVTRQSDAAKCRGKVSRQSVALVRQMAGIAGSLKAQANDPLQAELVKLGCGFACGGPARHLPVSC